MSYKARTFTREEFRKVIAAAIYDYEHAPAKCLYTTKDAADQLYGEYGEEIEVGGMNGVQLTNHLTAQFMASTISRYEAEIREDGDFRGRLYAMSLNRLKRKCEKYAKRERKAIEYVATLKEES